MRRAGSCAREIVRAQCDDVVGRLHVDVCTAVPRAVASSTAHLSASFSCVNFVGDNVLFRSSSTHNC
eukprot:1112290-Pleurochrysis_carterae.AAC.3